MKRFEDGRVYRLDEITPHTWGGDPNLKALAPDTPFRYFASHVPRGAGYFEQVVEPVDPLVSSEAAKRAIEHMREHGLSFREISRRAGVSAEAVHRAAGGVGRVRLSTQEALETVAAAGNGSPSG